MFRAQPSSTRTSSPRPWLRNVSSMRTSAHETLVTDMVRPQKSNSRLFMLIPRHAAWVPPRTRLRNLSSLTSSAQNNVIIHRVLLTIWICPRAPPQARPRKSGSDILAHKDRMASCFLCYVSTEDVLMCCHCCIVDPQCWPPVFSRSHKSHKIVQKSRFIIFKNFWKIHNFRRSSIKPAIIPIRLGSKTQY